MPIGVPTDVVLTIHPPIETKGMRDETEVLQKTYELVRPVPFRTEQRTCQLSDQPRPGARSILRCRCTRRARRWKSWR